MNLTCESKRRAKRGSAHKPPEGMAASNGQAGDPTVSAAVRQASRYLLACVVLFGGWQLLSVASGGRMVPGPVAAFSEFFRLMAEGVLWSHFVRSSLRVLGGMTVAAFAGATLGIVTGREKTVDGVLAPLIYLTHPIPKVVLLPVLLLFLGIGDAPKVALIGIIVFYQVLVTSRDAARSITPAAILSVRSLGATKWQEYRHVVIPFCLPRILTALRIGVGTSIAVLFFAESFATLEGLGYFILDSWGLIRYREMFAGIIAMALLGFVLYEILDIAERRLCKWNYL